MSDSPPNKPSDGTSAYSPANGEESAGNFGSKTTANNVEPLGLHENVHFEQQRQQNKGVLWAIFGLLLVLVISVFYLLPRYVSTPVVEPTVVIIDTSPLASPISPFEEAQQLKEREDAQNVLATLLGLQDSLQEQKVTQWATEEFANAIEHARSGDEHYSQQNFISAKNSYELGVNTLQDIESSLPDVFTQFVNTGSAAILTGNADLALTSFELAVAIYPNHEDALTGSRRALILSDVLNLLNQGKQLHQGGQLESAMAIYQEALTIDSIHIEANTLLSQVQTDITEQRFASFMSAGYASIQAGSPEQAQTAFQQALALKSNSDEALNAVELAADQITSIAVNALLSDAATHEADERWLQALNTYNETLAIDPNIVSAIAGRNRSNSRNNLDQFLESSIEQPLRLADAPVYDQTIQVHRDASTIPQPGPRLQQQLTTVQSLLQQITQAVDISFQSNGTTNVTIYKVAELGLFTSQSLALTPGTYIAVGVRDGFRDVRKEFTIALNNPTTVITVQCDEAI